MNVLVSLGVAILALSSPGAVDVKHNLAYASGDRGHFDVYVPRRANRRAPVVVFLYGGSWQSGNKGLYRFVGRSLASRGFITVIPDYRVYPEVRYPTFLRDNALAVAFVQRHAADWGGDPGRLFLIGHSAGAYNAAMLALDPRWLGEVGLDPRRDLAGVVGLAGPYDFLPLRDATLKTIFGPTDQRPDTQPINHVDGHAAPMLLLAGDRDATVDPGNSARLTAAIRAHGGSASAHIYPGLGHVSVLTSISGLFRRRGGVLDGVTAFVGDAPARSLAPVALGGLAPARAAEVGS
ncbi:MAG: esterase/lipase [Caulobacteraceae bacterium]|jgi:acetyl esterase/lipase|nr:esterase/lipase [Caulobacteraceae bacterium]